jgi:hypothetical protein
MTYAEIGTSSHGTMQHCDLIPTFADDLRVFANQADNADHLKLCDEADAIDFDADDYDDEDASYTLDELCDALNEYAPPYCYFGANEGDCSDYGFWPSIEAFEDACRDGEVLKVDDLSEAPERLPDGVEYIAVVNDHGNVTLYRPKLVWESVWGIV